MTSAYAHVSAFDDAVEVKDDKKEKTLEARFKVRNFCLSFSFSGTMAEDHRDRIRQSLADLVSFKADGVMFLSSVDAAAKGKKSLFEKHMKARKKTHSVQVKKKKGEKVADHLTKEFIRSLITADDLKACCIIDDAQDGKKQPKPLEAPVISVEEVLMDIDGKKTAAPKDKFHVITVDL